MCCGGWVHNARVQQLCSKALRMRSACYAIFCLARAAADGSLLRLTPGQSQHSAQFTYDVRPRSRRDRPSLIHGGAASLDRAPGCRQDFRSNLNFYRDVRPCLTSRSQLRRLRRLNLVRHHGYGSYNSSSRRHW